MTLKKHMTSTSNMFCLPQARSPATDFAGGLTSMTEPGLPAISVPPPLVLPLPLLPLPLLLPLLLPGP